MTYRRPPTRQSPLDGLIKRRAWSARFARILAISLVATLTVVGSSSAPAQAAFGTTINPGDDIQAVVDAHPAGTRFLMPAGLYRMQTVRPKDGNSFVGSPGAIMNGSRVLTSFVREGPYWVAHGQTQQAPAGGVCEPGYTGCRHPEDLFINNTMLRQVTARGELQPGSWYFDYAADKIYLAQSPDGQHVETSVARYAFYGFASNVSIMGLTIEKYATTNHAGAINANGSGWTIRDNEVRLNHTSGIRTGGNNSQVTGNFVHHNGKNGLGAWGGADSVFRDNEIASNNLNEFAQNWDGGGAKFTMTTRLIVRNNHVHDNRGTGLWLDVDNLDSTIDLNTVERNSRNGISFEVSFNATIRSNTVDRNGLYGIFIAHSPGVDVLGNRVRRNTEGSVYAIYNPARGSGSYGAHQLRNLRVENNTIVMPRGIVGIRANGTSDLSVYNDWGNRFNHNTYKLFANSKPYVWGNSLRTADTWQDTGNDQNSRWVG